MPTSLETLPPEKMASAVITLSSPQDYNLQSLAETTKQSLELLKPWTLLKPSPHDALGLKIAEQATKYTAAIQAGVSASYSGFTVTEEVLFLANSLPIEDQEDLQRYLVGMMELAKEARDNANKAYGAFRDVRKEIFALASQVELKGDEHAQTSGGASGKGTQKKGSARKGLPEYHRSDLEVLIKFAEHISAFADWWDWVKIETDPSTSKDQPISFQIDSLRDPEVVKRWNRLRSQYTAYVQMIGEIEDTDPQFFNLSPSPVPPSSDSVQRHESIVDDDSSSHEAPLSSGNQPGTPTYNSSPPQREEGTAAAAEEFIPSPGKGKGSISSRFFTHFKARYPKIAKTVKVFDPRGVVLVPGMLKSGFKKAKQATSKRMTLLSPKRHSQCSSPSSNITTGPLTMEPEEQAIMHQK